MVKSPLGICFAVEEQLAKEKMIHGLLNEKGNVVQEQIQLIRCVNNFYSKLFTEENISLNQKKKIINSINCNLLDDDTEIDFEESITEEELTQALFQMKKKKTPGYDGLTVEVYQSF